MAHKPRFWFNEKMEISSADKHLLVCNSSETVKQNFWVHKHTTQINDCLNNNKK